MKTNEGTELCLDHSLLAEPRGSWIGLKSGVDVGKSPQRGQRLEEVGRFCEVCYRFMNLSFEYFFSKVVLIV